MPTENKLPDSPSPDRKSRIRQRFREKLTRRDSKASRDNQARDQEIQSFLHAPIDGRAAPTTPEIRLLPDSVPQAGIHLPYNAASSQVKPKRPRKPNLSVQFATTPPITIGEGGDEAMLPVTELLSALTISPEPSNRVSEGAQISRPRTTPQPVASGYHSAEDDLLRPRPLQRRSTGREEYDLDSQDEQDDIARDSDKESTKRHTSLRSSLNSKTFKEDPHLVRSALTVGRHGLDKPLSDDGEEQHPGSATLSLRELSPATPSANSMAPLPSPLPSPQPLQTPDVSMDLNPSLAATGYRFDEDLEVRNQRFPERETRQPPQQPFPRSIVDDRSYFLRDVAKGLGDDAYLDFAARVQSFRNCFLLGLNAQTEPTLQQWVTAASWWFLKGRNELESSVRTKLKSAVSEETSTNYLPHNLRQAYVDIAKAWWITAEMTPTRHPKVKKLENRGPVSTSAIMQSFVDATTAELIQVHLSIVSNLRSLAMSMKRNDRLPPVGLELQGLDTRIFIAYPILSPSAASLLSPEATEAPRSFFPMPIKDTERHFNYGRMFVDVILDPGKPASQVILPCLLSVLRDKKDREITLAIASQDERVRLVVQPEARSALSWQDVHWETNHSCIRINLQSNFHMLIQLTEKDFRTVWGIHDYIRIVQNQRLGTKDETLVFEKVLRSFQYFEPDKSVPQFPAGPIEHCNMCLFECFKIITEGAGERRIHDGYRLMIVTPRELKTLSSVSHNLGRKAPIVFSFLRDEQGGPAMLLKMSRSSRDPSMVMSFGEQTDRERLFSLLNGTQVSSDEHRSDVLNLKDYVIWTGQDQQNAASSQAGPLGSLDWKRLQVLGRRSRHLQLVGPAMRICVECDMGSLADRVDLGAEELQLCLDFESMNRISIRTSSQSAMTMCFGDSTLTKELYESLRQMLCQVAQSASIRMFEFRSLHDLHTFQELITGFSVLFDGFAKTFAISRRRMVVPIHKRWESTTTRLQIVKHGKTIQLVAFFKDFSHGSCMSFVLKSTDVYESFARSGTPYLCMVDAKFALPKDKSDANHGYVSLGMPEYPGEHDDITIGFESEQGALTNMADRDSFSNALPAPVSHLSGLSSLRR
ncbi:MAG: hypothetical protein LQ338_001892 [Usnochroma carphineum]|nr:MAG: hypothetical protein LQ338_001892 [Usnochroma carphineum]